MARKVKGILFRVRAHLTITSPKLILNLAGMALAEMDSLYIYIPHTTGSWLELWRWPL